MNKILRTKAVIASSVAVVTFMVFLPALRNQFLYWDDVDYIYQNTFIRSLNMQLLKSSFEGFYAANWHPLTWLSHALDYAIWGLNPLGHHLTNNLLHSLNTLLVVFLVMRLIAVYRKTSENNGLSPSFLNDRAMWIAGAVTGLLFGLHPLHVESVAWVSERKDLLCACFFLLSITTYTYYVSEISETTSADFSLRYFNKKYLLCLVFFVLALLSKPMAVTLPFVLMILDWYLFRRMRSRQALRTAFIEKFPFFVLSLVSSLLTIMAQRAGETIELLQLVPLSTRWLVAAKSLISYLRNMILPLNLTPFYPYPGDVFFLSFEYILPVILIAGITITCLAVVRKQKLWMSVWSYYVLTLIPVIGIVQVGSQSMADRYTYLPSLAPFLIIGLSASKIYEEVTALNQGRAFFKMASLFIGLAILIFMSYATIKQISIWKDSTVFWNYIVAKNPSSHFAHNNLGNVYLSKDLLDLAIEQYKMALSLRPSYAEAHYNLGNAYSSKGLFDMAIEQYRTALMLKPNNAEAHFNLGLRYIDIGSLDMARTEFKLGLTIKPDDHRAQQVLNSIILK
jgi:tetratricopeptide (TPR) repeat protein